MTPEQYIKCPRCDERIRAVRDEQGWTAGHVCGDCCSIAVNYETESQALETLFDILVRKYK